MAAAALSSERLEVSIDGLTLSPDSEEGRGREAPGAAEEPGGDAAALSPERRWGFGLDELYGLALRFFKGERRPPPPLSLWRPGHAAGPDAGRGGRPPVERELLTARDFSRDLYVRVTRGSPAGG